MTADHWDSDRLDPDRKREDPCGTPPLQVAIIEAVLWIDTPLSASDLTNLIGDERYRLSHVFYHLGRLVKAEVVTAVRERQVWGAGERILYCLR